MMRYTRLDWLCNHLVQCSIGTTVHQARSCVQRQRSSTLCAAAAQLEAPKHTLVPLQQRNNNALVKKKKTLVKKKLSTMSLEEHGDEIAESHEWGKVTHGIKGPEHEWTKVYGKLQLSIRSMRLILCYR